MKTLGILRVDTRVHCNISVLCSLQAWCRVKSGRNSSIIFPLKLFKPSRMGYTYYGQHLSWICAFTSFTCLAGPSHSHLWQRPASCMLEGKQ